MSIITVQGEEEKRRKVRYEVDTTLPSLGEGGMGQVLRGVRIDERTGQRIEVAIKFLFEDLPQHAIERARREASIQIHNENLVEMFGFIEVEQPRPGGAPLKRYHVVSELLQGVMLFDLLNGKTTDKFGNNVPFAQELYTKYQNDKFGFAVLIIKNILSGLMALHDAGYIHRDLDPSNIMITVDRKIKIIDFGIAKRLDSLNTQDQQLTSTGQFVGKAAYAAPELVLGDIHHQDKTTDIYAVGIMLYQFIVGDMPFEGTIAELIKHQVNDRLPLKNVPYKAIRNIINKATAKKQSERYQSAAEMRVALEHLKKEDALPSKTIIDEMTAQMAEISDDNKKRIGMMAGIAAAVVALVVIAVLAWPSSKDDEQTEQPPVAVVSETETVAEPAEEDQLTSLLKESEANLNSSDSANVQKGVEQLQQIARDYSGDKKAAVSMALLAALTQPEDVTTCLERIKDLRVSTANMINRNAARGHKLAEKAVEADPTCYQALFELATDYAAAMARINKDLTIDLDKALELYKKGREYAQKQDDKAYVKLFDERIKQIESTDDENETAE